MKTRQRCINGQHEWSYPLHVGAPCDCGLTVWNPQPALTGEPALLIQRLEHLKNFCEQTCSDGIQPSSAWWSETACTLREALAVLRSTQGRDQG